MSLLHHIHRCNQHDASLFRPFLIGGVAVGCIHDEVAAVLANPHTGLIVDGATVRMLDRYTSFADRSAVLQDVAALLVDRKITEKLRGEAFPVTPAWGHPPLARIDRGAVAALGFPAFGVHVNGFVECDGAFPSVWIGRRSSDRQISPGKLDNLVAGGQPFGLGLTENLIKECAEEAAIGPELAKRARPVGVVAYTFGEGSGLRRDCLFVYDLALDPQFQPQNTDGEVAQFLRMDPEEILDRLETTDDFKFNVALVLLDFLIRHGVLTDAHPEYVEIARGLR